MNPSGHCLSPLSNHFLIVCHQVLFCCADSVNVDISQYESGVEAIYTLIYLKTILWISSFQDVVYYKSNWIRYYCIGHILLSVGMISTSRMIHDRLRLYRSFISNITIGSHNLFGFVYQILSEAIHTLVSVFSLWLSQLGLTVVELC